MCNHENIVAIPYAINFNGEIGDRIACKIQCRDCDSILYQPKKKDDNELYSYDKYVKKSYLYIEQNKENIKSLIDLTCNNLNGLYNIKDE